MIRWIGRDGKLSARTGAAAAAQTIAVQTRILRTDFRRLILFSLFQATRSVKFARTPCGRQKLFFTHGYYGLGFPRSINATSSCGMIGACAMCTLNGESASSIAEINAATAGMTPSSPTPLTPSGLRGDGVSLYRVSIFGTSVAVGSR